MIWGGWLILRFRGRERVLCNESQVLSVRSCYSVGFTRTDEVEGSDTARESSERQVDTSRDRIPRHQENRDIGDEALGWQCWSAVPLESVAGNQEMYHFRVCRE